MAETGDLRLRAENAAPLRPSRDYVVYWTTEARRTRWNRALTRAVALAKSAGRPLLVLDALPCGRALPPVVFQGVEADPLASPPTRRLERLPKDVADRWHPARKALLDGDASLLARLAIDGSVPPSELRGGEDAARAAWTAFL